MAGSPAGRSLSMDMGSPRLAEINDPLGVIGSASCRSDVTGQITQILTLQAQPGIYTIRVLGDPLTRHFRGITTLAGNLIGKVADVIGGQ